jgi:hypothetical protein
VSELPDDLAELERRLAGRPRPEPDAALRRRVVGSVRDELERDRRRFAGAWRYAAALAAAVLLGANLSLGVAVSADWRRDEAGDDIGTTVARLRQLDPELTEDEARRQALLLQTRAHLVPAPVVRPPAEQIGARASGHGD